MTTLPTPPNEDEQSRDANNWAPQITHTLHVTQIPTGALNLNVDGRQMVGPLQGFGRMWQKTYSVRLEGATVTTTEVIKVWKENFPKFWPKGNTFYTSLAGIAPGEIAMIKMSLPGGLPILSTGVVILYADDESFTVMTPQGHMFAGWNTFSAYEDEGTTVIKIDALIRPNDPLYEIGFYLGMAAIEDRFWKQTIQALAAYFGVNAPVTLHKLCVDPKVQWRYARNIWHNAGIRTGLYLMGTPVRWLRKKIQRTQPRQ